MWLLVILIGELFIIGIVAYLTLRIVSHKSSKNNRDVENSVKEGFKSAIKELEHEKEEEELLMNKLDGKNAMGVFSPLSEEKPINTGGDLIPFNLSDSEKEILRMFYNQ